MPPYPQIQDKLADLFINQQEEIDKWFQKFYCPDRYKQKHPDKDVICNAPPIYSSVDLRNNGYKIAPVDVNLFPAGFHQMSEQALHRAAENLKEFCEFHKIPHNKILLIPENHTRNPHYNNNVSAIIGVLKKVASEVEIGYLPSGNDKTAETDEQQDELPYIEKSSDNFIHSPNGFTPDLIIVNNDLSSGSPEILHNINQKILPPVGMGWYQRRKSFYFDKYQHLASEFVSFINKTQIDESKKIDLWEICTLFSHCGKIDFKQKTGLECVALAVDKLINQIKLKYQKYDITDEPYVFIKADSGTYGMGMMTVSSGEEVYEINKKSRNKMNIIKEGVQNSEVIIQEGIATIDTVNNHTAEPMIYLIAGKTIGGAWRSHDSKDHRQSLNSSGMEFGVIDDDDNDFIVYDIISKLATAATLLEEY